MSKHFFNTINLDGKELERADARAASQDKLISAIFKANPGTKITPSQMHSIFARKYDLHPPITSIRRSMTNLTSDKHMNVLTRLDEKIESPFASWEHFWILTGSIENHYKNGQTTAGDHASKIINSVQGDLFLNS
jgi:hypothetical protein